MVDVFVPNGYASKTFWPVEKDVNKKVSKPSDSAMVEIKPFSVYQLDHPHVIRKRPGHYGAFPRCRANGNESMDLVRKVLQPAINNDIVEVLKKYITVFQDAAKNVSKNMRTEPFTNCTPEEDLNIENMVHKACCDSLEHCKTLFSGKTQTPAVKREIKTQSKPIVASSLPNRLMMKRVPSPDFPWTKRLIEKGSPRRSLSPTPRPPKRMRHTPNRRYGSPQQGREPLNRDNWDPDRLTIDTGFIMGTKANKALGLGATRGRIYMKHPELFKYSSDPEDKKWMVKNNCMLATGGKNTFILIADDIFDLLDNEYKDSPHVIPSEMQIFKLPEFILQKMRALMIKEKKLTQKLTRKPAPKSSSRADSRPRSAESSPKPVSKPSSPHHSKRTAAAHAAAVIVATSEEMEENSSYRNSFRGRMDHGSSSADDPSASDSDNSRH